MNMTVEVRYDEVTDQNIENLREDVGPADVQLKKINLNTGDY